MRAQSQVAPGSKVPQSTLVISASGWSEARAFRDEWDQLNAASLLGPDHQIDWLDAMCVVHGGDARVCVQFLRRGGNVVAVAPFVLRRHTWQRMPIRVLEHVNYINQLHGTQVLIGAVPVEEVYRSLFGPDGLGAMRWDICNWYCVEGEPQAVALEDALAGRGYRYAKTPGKAAPYLLLPPSWDELMGTLQSRFRTTIRSRERAMEQAGKVELRFHNAPENVDAGLRAIEEIEHDSWKSESGLPVTHPKHWNFYRTYARTAATRGRLMNCVLYVNDEPLAFDYAVQDKGTYYLLQTSFKKSAASLYPGLVLRKKVINVLIEQKFGQIDFGKGDSEWKAKWTKTARQHANYTIFGRTLRGRAMHLAGSLKGRRAAGALPVVNAGPKDGGDSIPAESGV